MKKVLNKVKFAVTSTEGHSEYELLPKEALQKIRQLESEESKWVFVGNDHVKSETLTEKDLIAATTEGVDITLVTSIAGGYCEDENEDDCATEKVIKIDLEVVEKTSGIIIAFESNDYEKKVDIKVGKDSLVDIMYDRDIIVKALKRKLDNMAISQVAGLRKALNV